MAYLNPQLQERTTYMILMLKKWVVDNSYKYIVQEKYGQETCVCMETKLKVAVVYVGIMECYTFATTDNEDPYNCLTETELITIIEKSNAIIISNS